MLGALAYQGLSFSVHFLIILSALAYQGLSETYQGLLEELNLPLNP